MMWFCNQAPSDILTGYETVTACQGQEEFKDNAFNVVSGSTEKCDFTWEVITMLLYREKYLTTLTPT